MLNFHANGKLLLTSEYAITQGAKGLAVPTRYGQSLNYKPNDFSSEIQWVAKDIDDEIWFWANFSTTLEIIDTSDQEMAERLVSMLQVMKTHTSLLDGPALFTTKLEFPRPWGLGTSSTLASLLAQCSGVNALNEFRTAHGGSGYDLACGTADSPVLYSLAENGPLVEPTEIKFEFLNDIGFVYTGVKQDTRDSLSLVKNKPFTDVQIDHFNVLTEEFLRSKTILELEQVIVEHENIISEHLGIPRAATTLFKDYPGVVKSLGGWGGDFVMVTRLASSRKWLRSNGFKVIFPFKSLTL